MVRIFKQLLVVIVAAFTATVLVLFAYNYYRRAVMADEPEAHPPVIFERSDRPSRV